MSPGISVESRIVAPIVVAILIAPIGTDARQARGTRAGASRRLEGKYWKAIELGGQPTPPQDPAREAHLKFESGGRISGSDGCNRITATYDLRGDRVTFRQGAATQMACLNTSGIEQPFRDALTKAARLTVASDRLELLDASGARLAVFIAVNQRPASTVAAGLAGTSWQLVKFQGSDKTTLTPDDRAKYTIEFNAGGRLAARIDCNRGMGTWTARDANQIELGSLALTRAKCPPGSLHDQIVRQWPDIRSYTMRDGHLFLTLKADRGVYEFEPKPTTRP